MQYSELVDTLTALLQYPLPGLPAHLRMRPYRLEDGVPRTGSPNQAEPSFIEPKGDARLCAVLILFFPVNQVPHFALIQRPQYDGVHSGQVALPGGKQEPGETLQATALRETQEEIGVAAHQVRIMGKLTQIFVPPSKCLITPFVGLCEHKPQFVIDNYEVEEMLEVDLGHLLAVDVVKQTEVTVLSGELGAVQVTAPYFDLNKKVVWGATAAILSELREAVLVTTNEPRSR